MLKFDLQNYKFWLVYTKDFRILFKNTRQIDRGHKRQPDNMAKIYKLSRTSRSYTFVLININVVFEAFAQILRIGILVALNQDSGLVPEHRNHPTE